MPRAQCSRSLPLQPKGQLAPLRKAVSLPEIRVTHLRTVWPALALPTDLLFLYHCVACPSAPPPLCASSSALLRRSVAGHTRSTQLYDIPCRVTSPPAPGGSWGLAPTRVAALAQRRFRRRRGSPMPCRRAPGCGPPPGWSRGSTSGCGRPRPVGTGRWVRRDEEGHGAAGR